MMKKLTCIICPNGCNLSVEECKGGFVVTGNVCNKGRDFAIGEMTNPCRSVTSTVKTVFPAVPRLSVKTARDIPYRLIFESMRQINGVTIDHPVHIGDVIIEDVCGTGVSIVATSDLFE